MVCGRLIIIFLFSPFFFSVFISLKASLFSLLNILCIISTFYLIFFNLEFVRLDSLFY